MKKVYLLTKDTLFNDSLGFRAHIFNTLGLLGFALGFGFGLYYIFNFSGIGNIAGNLSAAVAAVIIITAANYTKAFKWFFLFTVIIVFLVIFPYLFFAGGGYHSGMPCFFVFAVVFTVIMLEDWQRTVFTFLEFALYFVCFLTAYYRPETVVPFPTEAHLAWDVVIGCMAAALVLAIAIHRHIVIYDLKMAELKKANDALERLDWQKTEFLSNVSHELKTPLTSVSGFARYSFRVMESENLSVEDVTEMSDNLRRIIVEADRMKRVVEQLLDVAAIERGKFGLRKQLVSISELADELSGLHFKTLNTNGNRLEIKIPPDLPNIAADHDRLLQVLLNLLSNALRHTKGGVIKLSARIENGQIALCVRDNGEGIPKELRGNLFERYLGADVGRAHGTGLGLYICKQIVEAHGGGIWIESESGAGTAVHFTLPLDMEGDHG